MAAIRALIDEYSRLTELTDAFYYAFRRQWMKENKPQGFDVQDIRIGALLLRLRHCRERLEDYAAGRISTIEELEGTPLDPFGRGTEYHEGPTRLILEADRNSECHLTTSLTEREAKTAAGSHLAPAGCLFSPTNLRPFVRRLRVCRFRRRSEW